MLHYDFTQPMTFLNALHQYTMAFNCVMVALRNESNFHDEGDHAVLNAATVFCAMLEDAHPEALALTHKLERRVLGMADNESVNARRMR